MFQTLQYQREDGSRPFLEWFSGLRDKLTQTRILARLSQIESGNLGDWAPVGDGVIEFRLHFGPGFRIYAGRSGTSWIVLLCGGDKSSQVKDIHKAKQLWSEWKRRQP